MRTKTTRYVLLGILAEAGPSSGYDIRSWIDQAIGHFWSESYGQIYPELKRLLGEGLVERKGEEQSARERKLYAITSAGRAALAEWLARAPQPDVRRSELLLKLFFGRFGETARARGFLEQAKRDAGARLAYLEQAEAAVRADEAGSPGLPYYLIAIDAGRRVARARLEWAEASLQLLDRHGGEAR